MTQDGSISKGSPSPRDHAAQRDLFGSFGNGWMRAFDIAVTPMVVAAIGYGLDRIFGIVPVLTIVFFLLGVGGMGARMYFSYTAELEAESAAGTWAADPRAWDEDEK